MFCAQPVYNSVDKSVRGVNMSAESYYLIYQEVNEEECSLTVQPFTDVDKLAEALNRLESSEITDYTIIKGKKMKATLRVAVELSEMEDDPG